MGQKEFTALNGEIETKYTSMLFEPIQKSARSYLFECRLLIGSRRGGPLQFILESMPKHHSAALFVRTHLPSNLN
jgi:hypothetical protein